MSLSSLGDMVSRLRAAGEETRMRVLTLLSRGALSVGEIAQILNQSQPRLSRHLRLLSAAGLVERLPEGAWVFYRLPADGPSRRFLDGLIGELDPHDELVRRDLERLAEIKTERAAAAEAYFSRIAGQWDAVRALHYDEARIEQAILEAAGPGPFDMVVDFGTGTGRMLTLFADRARRVEGIDLSHQMLTVARSNIESAGLANASVRHGDATAAPLADASVDLVILHQVLHFLDDPGRAMVEAARVLRPGGRLVVVDFAPHDLEYLRTEHAHRRLGLSDKEVAAWCARAGLDQNGEIVLGQPEGQEGLSVKVWSAARPAAALASEPGAAASEKEVAS
ncbi:MAG: metalloregulator ArsR/SmtB family transcription factor [Hyphomonadaceae bacterium]